MTTTETKARDTLIASIYYVGPEWVLAVVDPDAQGRLRYVPELGSVDAWRSRAEAEAEAIRIATARGASAVEFHDVDRSAPPYLTVNL